MTCSTLVNVCNGMFWLDLERCLARHKGSSVSDTEEYTECEYIMENPESGYSDSL